MTTRVLIILALAAASFAQAINSASFRVPGMPGYGVARGSMFVLFGNGLGPSGLSKADSLPLRAELEGTSVQVTVGSVSVAALIYYTSAEQVAAVLPSNTPAGEGIVVLTYNGRRSNPTGIRVVDSAFGVFTRNEKGFGPGIVQNYVDPATAPTNAWNAPLAPGQIGVIWGTGLGPIEGSDAGPPPVGNIGTDTVVLVGGVSVTPEYAGRSGSFPAIDQINFKVPDKVAGCFVPVAVKSGGVVSNYVSIAIAPAGSSCSDMTTYSSSEIDKAASTGQSRIGAIGANSVSQTDPVTGGSVASESAFAEFRVRPLRSFLASSGLFGPVPSPGSCTVTTFRVPPTDTGTVGPTDPGESTLLNAGLAVAVQSSAPTTLMPRNSSGAYTSVLSAGTLESSTITVQGGRTGNDVGPFQKSLALPGTISWTNIADVSGKALPRSTALEITWTGGDAAREFVLVRGMSTGPSAEQSYYVRGVFVCAESAATGSLTVPTDVLGLLPPGNPGGPDFVEAGTATRLDTSRFDAPGLDGGYVQVRRLERVPVIFQ